MSWEFMAQIMILASRIREKVLKANLPQVRFKYRQELARWEKGRQVEMERSGKLEPERNETD